MPRPPLSFGVELEVAVATLKPNELHPDPSETRFAHFVIKPFEADWKSVARHMENTLTEAGYPASQTSCFDDSDFTQWDVSTDLSVKSPRHPTAYDFIPIEIRSPAYYFTADALKAIEQVCALLTSTYLMNVNESTGLHVHVGNGRQGFKFDTIRRLMAFLWAFEPQIDSLHPPHRFNARYAKSMREESNFSLSHLKARGVRPTPLEGVTHFLKCSSIEKAVADAQDGAGDTAAYRFYPLMLSMKGLPDHKPTIEFRQHEGTVNGQRVTNWVQTAVGIVDFILDSHPKALTDLLLIVENEHWEKVGDESDAKREAEMGPILAERDFTIIDLLKHLKLFGPAAYYSTRLFPTTKPPRPLKKPPTYAAWDKNNPWLQEAEEFDKEQQRRKDEAKRTEDDSAVQGSNSNMSSFRIFPW